MSERIHTLVVAKKLYALQRDAVGLGFSVAKCAGVVPVPLYLHIFINNIHMYAVYAALCHETPRYNGNVIPGMMPYRCFVNPRQRSTS